MEKIMLVKVDIAIARKMLNVAGYDVSEKSDEEVFWMAINQDDCYGVKFEEV